MKKFKFKLEMVLKIKLRLEELRQQELREAEYQVSLARQELERCREAVIIAKERYRQQLSDKDKLNLNSALDYQRYLAWLDKHVILAEEVLSARQEEVARAREALMLAAQERQMLEKLKEKAYQNYLQAELQAEHEFLDELGTSRYIRMER